MSWGRGRILPIAAVWALLGATTLHAQTERARPGGSLHLLATTGAGSIDPQVNYTGQYWQLFAIVYDGLVAFRRAPGAAGLAIVPDLADSVPAPSADGLTYVFHMRSGIRFADGNPVRASDAAASLRRIFRVLSPTAGTFYATIAGAQECLQAPRDCALPGAVADDAAATLTLHLTRPDPELLMKLALPHASVLPPSAPDHEAAGEPIAGTGPYRFAAYDPGRGLRLERNPLFRAWNPQAQPPGLPDVIDYSFGLEDEAEVTQIENDQADWMFDAPPLDRLAELGADYAGQVHLAPAFALWFLAMNLHEKPFDDIRVRRAVNMAMGRKDLVKLFGGPRLARPSCQIVPPGLPGYEQYCPFAHDPAAARALIAQAGATGARVALVIDSSALQRSLGTYVLDALQAIGLDVRLRVLSSSLQSEYIGNTSNHVQISLSNWYADYPGASDFLPTLFSCGAFHPGSDSSVNLSGLCDPALDARMDAVRDPRDWAAIDREITDRAAFAVLFNPDFIDVTSRRVERFVFHPLFHWLLAQ